ncbi:MAG: hypothetical protein PSV16_04945 [Flavobacterium sp.]|nr:hypothetical protein [Flavobacterium sp.]
MPANPYTTLKDVFNAISSNIKEGNIELVPTVFDTDNIGTFYKKITIGNSLSFSEAVLDPAAWSDGLENFALQGTTSSFGLSMGVTMTFSDGDTGIASELKATAADFEWNIAGIDWFGLSAPFIGVNAYEKDLPPTGIIGGNIVVSNNDGSGNIVNLELQMAYPVPDSSWVFTGNFEAPYPSISNFYQLIGGVNLSASLPQPFSTLTDLGLQDIEMTYDSEGKSVESFGVTISTSADYQWELISNKLFVNGISIYTLISSPGSSEMATEFTITGIFTIGPANSNTMAVTASFPNFKANVELQDGTIQIGDVFTLFLPDVKLDLKSEITQFLMEINPSTQVYSLNAAVESDWTFLSLSSPKVDFTMTGMKVEVASQQGSASGKFTGLFNIGGDGTTTNPGVDVTLVAGYDAGTWNFNGSTGKGQPISLIDIAYTFLKPFGIGDIPTWVSSGGVVLNVSDLSFSAVIPPSSAGKPNTYKVGGKTDWQLNFNSFNLSLKAVVAITFAGDKTSGKVTATTKLLGLKFDVGYEFGAGKDIISLTWEGINASYTYNPTTKQDIFAVTFTKMSLGDIVTKFMGSFIPGFQLSAPWSVLNSISLDGLSFTYTRNTDSTLDTIVIAYNADVNLGFLNISAILLTKDNDGVHLGFTGTFLGMTIEAGNDNTKALAGKGSKVQDMPAVPGMGSDAFDLKFLALGQHIELTNSSSFESVDEAVTAMQGAFADTNNSPNSVPIKAGSGPLAFNQNSDWLIGADFTVAQFYRMAFVFNDPNLYGLVIGVSDKAEFLKNLEFEILYKKINDSIGVYQMELQLPDVFRHLEFGEVSITLPNIGLKIYTNGNFYIDIGWPASITDFSRSFTLQIFPFIGSGGFYFASLTGATATDLPVINSGVFNPVIEAGIALSVGVGKTVDEGILKAGLSLTAIGIFQGTFATYTAPNVAPYSGQTDTYYRFSGTLALVGRIYGEINFAIISASLDITAYIQISFVVEAYKAIPITFEAGVSVSLTVRINLGLFKISIRMSFSATITASFTIGTDTTNQSLWYKVNQQSLARPAYRMLAASPTTVKWQPLTIDTGETFGLDLYFIPHLTISGETGQNFSPGPQYVGMLYIDTGTVNPGAFTQFGMTAMATGALYWAANAIIGSENTGTKLSWLKDQEISIDALSMLLCYVQTRPDNAAPFNYKNATGNDVESFLKSFFTVQVSAVNPDSDTVMDASVFPILPELQMQTVLNGTNGDLVDFSTQSMTGNQGYLSDVNILLRALSASFQTTATEDYFAPTDCAGVTDPNYEVQPNLSVPTFIFTDFMAMAVKQLLQNAIDYLNAQGTETMKVSDMVAGVITADNVTQLGGMASRFMLHGLRLPEPPVATSGAIQPLYALTGQQWTVPQTLMVTDTYAVNLMNANASWITFMNPVNGALNVVINKDDIQRTINLRANTLNPSVIAGYPKALDNVNNTPQSFSLGGAAEWAYPGQFFSGLDNMPTIWRTPSNFRDALQQNTNGGLTFNLQTLTPDGDATTKGTIANLKWATMLNVNIQKLNTQDLLQTPLAGNVYNLVGADDISISLLEDLIVYKNTNQGGQDGFIEQIQILMTPDPATGKAGLVSAANGDLNAAIVQANLSTDTNPETIVMARGMMLKSTAVNTLNKPGDYITLLWECSIVRSGGFYFYYITPADGKGLPDYLFGETGTANVQMVITFADFIPQPFINAVITGDDLDFSKTTVYAQSPDITVPVPSLMQGNVGYELSRNFPGDFNPTQNPPTQAEDQVYLQNQFNLLGVSLPAIPAYQNYMPAGPVDTLDQDALQSQREGTLAAADPNAPWNYSAAIPYYRFVQGANDDPDFPNFYAGIGTNVQMSLNWQDMFGNMPTGGVNSLSVSMPLLYTDGILSVSQWPSVSSFYLFDDEGSGPELTVNFCFDVSRYNDGTEGALNNATVDLETYMRLFYQLMSGDMLMSFASTIQGTEAAPEGLVQSMSVSDLATKFVKPVINYLKGIINNSNPDPVSIPIPYAITTNVDVNNIASYADSIALSVNVTMQRTKNVDPDFADAPGVASAVTAVKPQAQSVVCGKPQTGSLSLSYFAGLFEQAFTDKPSKGILIKIATSSDSETVSGSTTDGTNKPIWMVRFDTTGVSGIRYTYDNDKVYFFAPIPLATSLVSMDAGISPYQTGKAFPAGAAVSKRFSAIDLDDYGRQFLESVDSFLAPGFAVPAFLLDNGKTLQDILDQKQALADAIEGTIDYIIDASDKSGANIGNAQEKWKQQLLRELSATYKYSAAIQTPVTIDSSWNGSNSDPVDGTLTTPKLFGNMVGNDPTVPDQGSGTIPPSTEYSLSTAKLPLADGQSWLTYMFESKNTPEFRNFQFGNMQFKVSHLEQMIMAIEGINGYTSSSWLTFILPLAAELSNVGDITIPVPLRAYPTPPSITEQLVNYPVAPIITMQDARTWDFIYSYRNAIAAQDTIETQVMFNIPSDVKPPMSSGNGDVDLTLDVALAQFIAVYPLIAADFKLYLANLTQKDVQTQSAIYTNAMYAVAAFTTIVGQVAGAWANWNQVNPRGQQFAARPMRLGDVQQPIILNFTVIETGAKLSGYLNVQVIADANNPLSQIPVIKIPGYKESNIGNNTYQYIDDQGVYLDYSNRNVQQLRNVVINSLDILNTQNAWGGAQIVRNLDLLPDGNGGWQTTNKNFLYQTPMVKFYAKLIALLNDSTSVNIATIGTDTYPVGSRSLGDNMLALFDAFTKGVSSASLSMKMTVDYTYMIPGTQLPVTIPVLLATPFSLTTADKGATFANSLTTQLNSWLTASIANESGGTFNFEIDVFSSIDTNTLIFQLPLYLEI